MIKASLSKHFPWILGLAAAYLIGYGAGQIMHPPKSHEGSTELSGVDAVDLLRPNRLLYGTSEAPYKLAVFSAYDCPHCLTIEPELAKVPLKSSGRIAVYHCNLPRSQPGSISYQFAVAAALAEEIGRFKELHRALLLAPLSEAGIEQALSAVGILQEPESVRRATALVEKDISLAKKMDVLGTPTFVLCSPDGRVVKFDTLEQVLNEPQNHGSAGKCGDIQGCKSE